MTKDIRDRCKHCGKTIVFLALAGDWVEADNHNFENDLCPANHNGPHHPVFPVEGIDY